MNIGFDAKRLYNNFTGLGNYSRTLVLNLSKYYPENTYTLYTPKLKNSSETQFFISHQNIRTFVPEVSFKAWWRSFSIKKQLKKDQIDIYHGLSHEIPFRIKRSGIKSVVTIHDLIFEIYPHTYSFLDRLIYRFKFKYACKQSDRIIAISESTKKDIVKLFGIDPDKIDVVYQACNPLFKIRKTSEEIENLLESYALPEKFFLYVGSVIERKNLISLINAYECLEVKYQLPLVIVGKGRKYKTQVMDLISQRKLDDKVIWIDNLTDNHQLQAMYQKAEIFIYPSLYEGFGIPVIEALLSGTPVITSNTSSMPEAGGPFSYYVDPLNPKQIAEGISQILSDPGFREQMIENGYQYAITHFNDHLVSEKLIEVYRRVL